MLEVFRYQTAAGDEPVTDWLRSLHDKQAQATDIKTAKGYWSDWKRRQV